MARGCIAETTLVSGERVTTFKSLPFINSKAPVILLHGSGAPIQYSEVTRPHSLRVGPELCREGRNCISGEMGGQTWANDVAMSKITAAIDKLKVDFGLISDKVHLVGQSMGGALGLRYAIENPTKVLSYTGVIPLCDLVGFYNAQASYQSQIAPAWGVAAGDPLPAAADLKTRSSVLNGVVATRLYYSSNDTLVIPEWVTGPGEIMGAQVYNMGALGHTDITYSYVLDQTGTDDWFQFLNDAEA